MVREQSAPYDSPHSAAARFLRPQVAAARPDLVLVSGDWVRDVPDEDELGGHLLLNDPLTEPEGPALVSARGRAAPA